jgi:hypothetical protein
MSAWRSFLKKTVKFPKFHERLFYSCSDVAEAFRVVWSAAASLRTFVLVSRFENFLAKITKYHEHLFYSCSRFSPHLPEVLFRVAILPGSALDQTTRTRLRVVIAQPSLFPHFV